MSFKKLVLKPGSTTDYVVADAKFTDILDPTIPLADVGSSLTRAGVAALLGSLLTR